MKPLVILLVANFMGFGLVMQAQEQAHQPTSRPDSHAPIGVMGDHFHKKGEFMFSYRFMHMNMEDNRIGTDDIDPSTIVTTIPNRFFGSPMQPPTLRVVPTEMTMNMHMLGVMYAVSDNLTLMAMTMFINMEMSHITYQGGMGTNVLGGFVTETSGIGDTRLAALIKLWTKEQHRIHANLGVSIPTGSITERDNILTPMEATPTVRLPYPMQLGSGTFDLMPGITYAGFGGQISWGAQFMSTLRLGENSEDYRFGHVGQLTGWGAYAFAPWISSGLRLTGVSWGSIEEMDHEVVAPVQTADPDFHGGKRLDASVSVNLIGQRGFVRNHRLAVEYGLPLVQDLNGPQLKTRSIFTIGWQYAI